MPGSLELSLDVLEYGKRGSERVPSVGAHVRFDNGDAAVEVQTDAKGHAAAVVDSALGPWDVTVARARFIPVSILGVTGPISSPIVLSALDYDPSGDLPAQLAGSVRRGSPKTWQLNLSPGPSTMKWDALRATYKADVFASNERENVRFLATELGEGSIDEVMTPWLNATWLDAAWTGTAWYADVVFPATPRRRTQSRFVLEAPTTGAVSAEQLKDFPQRAVRLEAGRDFDVGWSWLEPVGNQPGRYDWVVHALDGDMAPNQLGVDARDEDGKHWLSAYLTSFPEEGSTVRIPPAEILNCEGTRIEDVRLSWRAPEHQHQGAWLQRNDRGPGTWYLYTYSSSEAVRRPWPRLPSQVSLQDVGLADAEISLNVFAASFPQGDSPWDGNHSARLSVGRTFISPILGTTEPPTPRPAPDPPPLFWVEGIYEVTSATDVLGSCDPSAQGTPKAEHDEFFYLLRTTRGVQIGSCESLEACRSYARPDAQIIGREYAFWVTGAGGTGDNWDLKSPDADGVCRNSARKLGTFSVPAEATVEIQLRSFALLPYPAEADACTYEKAFAATSSETCGPLERIEGTYLEAL